MCRTMLFAYCCRSGIMSREARTPSHIPVWQDSLTSTLWPLPLRSILPP